jgi:hypothetical protein
MSPEESDGCQFITYLKGYGSFGFVGGRSARDRIRGGAGRVTRFFLSINFIFQIPDFRFIANFRFWKFEI